MTNKEWYKRAFSSLHTSPDFMVQLENRKTAKWSKKWAFAGAFMVLIIGTSTIYAANIGGIQRTIQIWMHGELTDATLTIDENNGTYSIKDPNGKAIQSGGGVAIDTQGHSRALTPEEIMEDQENMVSTEKIDGHMYLYYKDQKYDITNLTDEEIQSRIDKLNKRPRKVLGYRTPYEIYYSVVLHLT